jgi:hypothetical protein
MKTLKLKEAQTRLGAWIDIAQSESLLVTQYGKSAALIIGVAGHELEDLLLETDPAFWAMIEERRQQPTMGRAKLDEYLCARDHEGDGRNEKS